MYASPVPRYSRSSHFGSPTRSYSPPKYGGCSYVATSSALSYDDRRAHHHSPYYAPSSPPLKAQSYHRAYGTTSSALGDYYSSANYVDGTTYYTSTSSTASSSQDGYYGDDLDDEFDEYAMSLQQGDADPEMTTVPTIPTPLGLSKFEQGKTPSGRLVITSGNQTVEFFSCVVNAPNAARCVYATE